jgi:hypothetical protein
LDAKLGMNRLPLMPYTTKQTDCGAIIEMEFTQAPMGIVFQVSWPRCALAVVTASADASMYRRRVAW